MTHQEWTDWAGWSGLLVGLLMGIWAWTLESRIEKLETRMLKVLEILVELEESPSEESPPAEDFRGPDR